MTHKVPLFVAMTLSLAASPALSADVYDMDPGHTEVIFGWSHAGVSVQHGEFHKVTGTLELNPDAVESSVVNVAIDPASVSTGVTALDTHLKSGDFLDVEAFPTVTFVSTSITSTGEETVDIVGDLTLHGVTKPVTLQAVLTHRGEHPVGRFLDYYKGEWVAFTASTSIDHQAFGVGSYSTGPISIEITTEMKKR